MADPRPALSSIMASLGHPAPPPQAGADPTSLGLAAILGMGAWVAALLLCLAAGLLIHEWLHLEEPQRILGPLGMAGIMLGWRGGGRGGMFLRQFVAALAVAGFGLTVFSIGLEYGDENDLRGFDMATIAAYILAVGTTPLVNDAGYRFLVAVCAALMSIGVFFAHDVPHGADLGVILTLAPALAMLLRPAAGVDLRPSAHALLLAAAYLALAGPGRHGDLFFHHDGVGLVARFGLAAGLLVALAAGFGRRLLSPGLWAVGLAALLALGLALPPAAMAGLMLLGLGAVLDDRRMAGLGVGFQVYAVSRWYYDLDFTLMQKSGLLVLAGTLLLVLAGLWHRHGRREGGP